jgi:hypothetical protein
MKGSAFCVMHSGIARELGRRGGLASRGRTHDLEVLPPPRTATALRELLATTAVEIRALKMNARTASSLAAICNVLVRVQDVTLEQRIVELERKAQQREQEKKCPRT